MKHPILTLLLLLCILCSLMAITVFAEEKTTSGTCGDSLTWNFVSSTLYIEGTGEMEGYALSNPPWEPFKNEIQAIIVSEGVTSIGGCAFAQLDSLVNVDLPSSLFQINHGAFYGCDQLAEISIPVGLDSIGSDAFEYCTSLTEVSIPSTITSIGNYAFAYCANLTTVFFEGSVPTIASYTFYYAAITAFFPANNSTWTNEAMVGYGGTISWNPYCHNICNFVTLNPTCTENGYACYVCGECGAHYLGEVIPAIGHSYCNYSVAPPTCTNYGYTKYSCIFCDDSYIDDKVPALGHEEIVDAAIPATCTDAGLTEGKHCFVCETVFVEQKAVSALGHDFGAWTETKAPTCTEKGEEVCSCNRCDVYETREVAKTMHHFKGGVCTICGAEDPNYKPEPVEFSDVSEKAWYYDAVEYAVTNGLMNGVGKDQFDPDGTMTRAMLVTVLWRYEGEPDAPANTFSDVKAGTWYADAVSWAASTGVVNGVGNNKFDPDGNITREQMATILYRYCAGKGIDTSKQGSLSGFPDAEKVSSYAQTALQWTVAEGIIGGSDGKLLPQGNATRAQVATILMRFIENIA